MTWMSTPYVRAGIELDRIALEGITAVGHHGVLPEERQAGQTFVADVVIHTSTRAAAAHDDLAKTVNYAAVAQRVADIISGEPRDLIETVAEQIALAVLEMSLVSCVDVRLHKPQAPIPVPFGDVSVTIRRDIRTGGLWADKRIGSSAGAPQDPLLYGGETTVRDQFDQRPFEPVPALLALGGNLGDVELAMRETLDALDRIPGIHVRATSPLVKSAPMGGPPQPDYLNAVVRVTTSLTPRELLAACHGIEIVHGRERSVQNGPRTLDIDIIDFDGTEGVSDDLQLPHPRVAGRGFVLVPWTLMEPDAVLPGLGSVREAARPLQETVQVVVDPWPATS